ncbi:MAG: hypothetical protein ACXV8O_19690 [Methylobacter sp.]
MKAEIQDEFYSEFECLTNLIEKIDSSQDFKNPRELIAHRLTSSADGLHVNADWN